MWLTSMLAPALTVGSNRVGPGARDLTNLFRKLCGAAYEISRSPPFSSMACVVSCARLSRSRIAHHDQCLRHATGTNSGFDGLLVQNLASADGGNVNVTATVAGSHRFCFGGLRRRTPGPPPFSSMNSGSTALRCQLCPPPAESPLFSSMTRHWRRRLPRFALRANGRDLKSPKDWVRFAKTSPVLTASALAAFEAGHPDLHRAHR